MMAVLRSSDALAGVINEAGGIGRSEALRSTSKGSMRSRWRSATVPAASRMVSQRPAGQVDPRSLETRGQAAA